MTVSSAAVTFKAIVNGANPEAQQITVSRGGTRDRVDGLQYSIDYDGHPTAPWLRVSLSSTSTPATLNVSASIAGLSAGTYMASVTLVVGSGTEQRVSVILIVQPENTLLAPTDFQGVVLSPWRVSLSWTNNTGDASGIIIESCTNVTFCTLSFYPFVTATEAITIAGTTFTFRVRAYKNVGDTKVYSEFSAPVTITTPEPQPMPPSRIILQPYSSTQIILLWDRPPGGHLGGYLIERCLGQSHDCAPFVQIDSIDHQQTSYMSSGLEPGTTYTYRIRTHNSSAYSSYSPTASATTMAVREPTMLEATYIQFEQFAPSVVLSWTDNSTNATGFKIQQCIGGNCVETLVPKEATATFSGRTRYQTSALNFGTTYEFRVKAVNQSGSSAWSNRVSVTTPAAPPAAPSQLSSSTSGGKTTVTWIDNSTNETGFEVRWCSANFAQQCTSGWVNLPGTEANVTSYEIWGLVGNPFCIVEVRAVGGTGLSAWARTQVCTLQVP